MKDIELLIKLTGNKRVSSELEKEIFANKTLTRLYLSQLHEHNVDENRVHTAIYDYALSFIEGRWIEAEHIIARQSICAYYYAKYVIKDRWIEAEKKIKHDPVLWDLYCADFNLKDE